MNCSRVSKIGFAILLLASLSLKVLLHEGRDQRQPAKLNDALSSFFKARDFEVRSSGRARTVAITATRDRCNVKIREADPFGAGADAAGIFAVDGGGVRFVFRGVLYPKQPIWAGAASYLANSIRQHLFLSAVWEPVLIVGTSPSCNVEPALWQSVASL